MKILLVVNDIWAAWHFRRGLIAALIDRGIEVTVVTPDGPYVSDFNDLGAKHVAVPMARFLSPWRDLRLCFDLYRVFRAERPDVVHTMTVKPNVFGAVAARLAGVPRIVGLAAGLGSCFMEGGGWKRRVMRSLVSWLYWIAGKCHARMWFQNPDDLELFVNSGILHQDKAVLIRGSGVNAQECSSENVLADTVAGLREELEIAPSTRVVLMGIARITWSKGVQEFIEASELAADWSVPTKFILVGGPLAAGDPDAVPDEYLKSKASPRFVQLGFRSDMRELLCLADVVTLPSFYREGIPRFLIEAAAMRKPIVTTDNVGCREVVEEGRNGFLVPARDSTALASAIKRLLEDDALRTSFGNFAREKFLAEFDESIVTARVLRELYQLEEPPYSECQAGDDFKGNSTARAVRALVSDNMAAQRTEPSMTRTLPASNAGGISKRFCDFVLALLGLILLSPLLLGIALAIKIGSPGPIFYRGVRTGWHFKPFRIFKFRSMVANAEQLGGSTASVNDPRVTNLGRYLRKFKLDELPQLLNVLLGDMSFVGPRPEVPFYTDKYTEEERPILAVRPGITDFASIEFSNQQELIDDDDDPEATFQALVLPRKNALRLKYVRERSFLIDQMLLLKTVCLVLRKPFGRKQPEPAARQDADCASDV